MASEAAGVDEGIPPQLPPPVLLDIQPPKVKPVVVSSPVMTSGPKVTPQQYLYFYSPGEWEEFVKEWATGLEPKYVSVKNLGGSNDQGVDVAGFATRSGFEGDWDCFQCKYYQGPLNPSDIWPELVKVFRHAEAKDYVLPRRYLLMAPQGCGLTLDRLLSKPTELKKKFIEQLAVGKTACAGLTASSIARIISYITDVNFSFIESVPLDDVISVHKKTPYHVARFGTPLPDRPGIQAPPDQVAANEARYVEQLVEIYQEYYSSAISTPEEALKNGDSGHHFRRQRELFYSAESLRLFARDSVPPQTFEALQDDVYEGVVEVAEKHHPSGMDRLSEVLSKVSDLSLSSNILLDVSNIKDRKGICHQLANVNKLRWGRGGDDESTK
ncbi:ABC-three component system protein [Amycolatopsis japonica]|uniref:ABC-three component system protein n=1 Tax=Amycolatopsis japonica TaxID=208439 RepID=UPI0033243B2C